MAPWVVVGGALAPSVPPRASIRSDWTARAPSREGAKQAKRGWRHAKQGGGHTATRLLGCEHRHRLRGVVRHHRRVVAGCGDVWHHERGGVGLGVGVSILNSKCPPNRSKRHAPTASSNRAVLVHPLNTSSVFTSGADMLGMPLGGRGCGSARLRACQRTCVQIRPGDGGEPHLDATSVPKHHVRV